MIAQKICLIFLFVLLGLYLNQGSGDNAPKKFVCMQICRTLVACIYDAVWA